MDGLQLEWVWVESSHQKLSQQNHGQLDKPVMRSGFTAARCVRRASHGLSQLQQLILKLIVVWKMKQSDLSTKQVHQI